MQKYGLLGYPLGHFVSKHISNLKPEKIDSWSRPNFEIPSIKKLRT